MTTKIDVLDHGFVRLVSYMQPVPVRQQLADYIPPEWTGDLEVVRNARVSFDADWRTGENEYNDERLIGTLMRNGHTSPFEANEISARYAELPEEFYVPKPEHIGVQSKSNKQARDLSTGVASKVTSEAIADFSKTAFELYHAMLEKGVPRELARTVLPLATYTRFFGTADLHNLFHFLRLRLHAHAQWEMQQYAMALLSLIGPIVPVAVAAFEKERTKREVSKD